MRISRFIQCTIAALALAAVPAVAQDGYPAKPVRLLVGFSPGGGQDLAARIIGTHLAAARGQSVIVENRPGANGVIATEAAARATPDGYTLHLFTANDTVNAGMRAKLPYDTLRDLAPVSAVSSSPYLLGVHPALPVKNAKELIALAKARPGQLNYGTGGNATTAHVSVALFSNMTGVQMTHVPYKGAPVALLDLIGGRLDLMFDQILSSMGYISGGRLRPIAVTPAKRTALLPQVPTLAESGVPGYEFTAWWMIAAPAKTPSHIVDRFNAELQKASADRAFRERLAKVGADAAPALNASQTTEFLKREIERWAKVVKAANIRAE